MTKYLAKISKNISESGLKTRPNANHGFWLIILLPAALVNCHLNFPQPVFSYYKLCSLISIGTVFTAVEYLVRCARKKGNVSGHNMAHTAIAAMVSTFVYSAGRGFIFSLYSGILSSFIFHKIYFFTLNTMALSFSVGEAAVVSQSAVLFFYSSSIYLFDRAGKVPVKSMEIATIISQLGLLGIGLICFLVYKIKFLQKPVQFYTFFVFGIFSFVLLPMHFVLKRSPLLWIAELLVEDGVMVRLLIYIVTCCLVAVLAIDRQIKEAKKASTVTRKIFHVLAVLVYFPALLYKCTFLYLASSVTLGIFIALEMIRILNLPPLGRTLQDGFSVFCDEKDCGGIALTPIYLLGSVSMPLWLHPTPCDVTDSVGFNLLPLVSGLLAVGIGDTAASVCGKLLGRKQWPGTKKTVEGTIGCILSQIGVIYLLYSLGFINYCETKLIKTAIAVFSTSLIEAFTSQVDNLALPLLMFTILV